MDQWLVSRCERHFLELGRLLPTGSRLPPWLTVQVLEPHLQRSKPSSTIHQPVTLDKLLCPSESQFPAMQDRDNMTYHVGFLEMSWTMTCMEFRTCLYMQSTTKKLAVRTAGLWTSSPCRAKSLAVLLRVLQFQETWKGLVPWHLRGGQQASQTNNSLHPYWIWKSTTKVHWKRSVSCHSPNGNWYQKLMMQDMGRSLSIMPKM